MSVQEGGGDQGGSQGGPAGTSVQQPAYRLTRGWDSQSQKGPEMDPHSS